MLQRKTMLSLVTGLALATGLVGTTALAMADDARINGTVMDGSTGKAISGAQVTGRDGAGTEIRVKTDGKGRYGAIGLAFGNVTLAVAYPGYSSEQITCRIPSGDSAKYTFVVYRGHGSRTLNPTASTCKIDPYTSDKYVIQ